MVQANPSVYRVYADLRRRLDIHLLSKEGLEIDRSFPTTGTEARTLNTFKARLQNLYYKGESLFGRGLFIACFEFRRMIRDSVQL